MQYDAIVIGAGQAGPPLAETLAQAGDRVAVIERHRMGGTCVNVGCTPTKTLVMYARKPHRVISRSVHIHPTVSELIPTMLQDLRPLD